MGNSIYGIAVTGLNAAKVGLQTTSHNIANANTEGYSRQTITQAAILPQQTGNGYVGSGVQVTAINRIYDDFQTRQVQTATAQDGYLTSLNDHLTDIDNLLADPSAGFSPSLQDFFTGVQTVANDPSSGPARQSLLGLSESMVTKLQTINGRLTTLRSDLNGELQATVGKINSITGQIANLNDQIALTRGSSGAPNDLLDKRDELVKQLNQEVKATVVTQVDGSFNIFIGNGQNLVAGNQAFTLGAVPATDDPRRLDVAYQQYGSTAPIPQSLITGGSLGGLLQFRTDVLDAAQNSLGRVAMTLAQTMNNQQRQGQDLNGQIGGNYFKLPLESAHKQYGLGDGTQSLTATLQSNATNPFIESDFNVQAVPPDPADPTTLDYVITRLTDGQKVTIPAINAATSILPPGTGQPAFGVNFQLSGPLNANEQVSVSFSPAASAVIPNAKNVGNGQLQVSVDDTNQLTGSDYTFNYQGPDYSVTRNSDKAIFTVSAQMWANPPVVIDGLRFQLNGGSFTPGDSFLVRPTRDLADNLSVAISDPAKIAAAAPIRSSADTFSLVTSKTPTSVGDVTAVSASIEAQGGVAAKRINLVFTSPTTYDVQDAATNTTLAASQTFDPTVGTISYNGWTVSVTGADVGDQFTIDPRRNTGTGQIAAGTVSGAPVNVKLQQPVSLVFDSATTYQLRDPATGAALQVDPVTGNPISNAYTSGSDISFNGWKTQVSGVPAAGDTFLIEPNLGGVSDNRNILAMGQLQTANTISNGSVNYQSAYSQIVSNIGVQANQAGINQKAQASLLQQAINRQQSTAGVNLDEEASNLLIFQQAYQAASKTIQIAQQAFQQILNING